MNIDKELDVRGLSCPLPILMTRRALDAIDAGKVLKVTATGAGSAEEFQAFARRTGNEILSSSDANGGYEFLMRKK